MNLPQTSGDVFRLTVKKSGVETSPEFTSALEKATDAGGNTFLQYINDADTCYRDSRKRSSTARKAVVPPGKGMAPTVRETLAEELPMIPYMDPISIRWQKLDSELFFQIDREDSIIVLNQHYRSAVLGGRRGGLNDAPLLKSLMYILLHQVFEKEYSGSREKDNLQLWQVILVSAARAEINGVVDGD